MEIPLPLRELSSTPPELPLTKDAVKSPQWKDWQGDIQKEMDSSKQHDVHKLVNISSVTKGEKIIGSHFVFKQKADGRFKARLVVQGHVQEPGIDYWRSYAPVCRIGSIRTLLAIACKHGWPFFVADGCGGGISAVPRRQGRLPGASTGTRSEGL